MQRTNLLEAVESGDLKGLQKLLVTAIEQQNELNVAEILKAGVSLVVSQQQRINPLCIAAEVNHIGILKMLIAHGARVNQGDYHDGRTPLCAAASAGSVEIVSELLLVGANVHQTNYYHQNASVYATKAGHISILEILRLNGLDLRLPGNDGGFLVIDAVACHHVDVLRYLHQLGADLNVLSDAGETLATIAAYDGDIHMINALHELGMDLNLADKVPATPLSLAVHYEFENLVRTLLACKIRTENVDIVISRSLPNTEIIVLLLLAGCNVVPETERQELDIKLARLEISRAQARIERVNELMNTSSSRFFNFPQQPGNLIKAMIMDPSRQKVDHSHNYIKL